MSFPPALLEALLAAYPAGGAISLDEFADRVAPHGLASDAIDALMAALESEGRSIDGAPMNLQAELATVLAHARRFVAERGRRPAPAELATYAGVPEDVVRRALVFGRWMAR
ncbi:MAG: hypothetical protein U0414_35495 [Polyangiaceae bacterium]